MKNNIFRLAVIPMDIAWGDIDENLHTAERLLRQVDPNTDLVVLPELFSTGFITEPTLLVPIDAAVTARVESVIRGWASRFGFAINGSMVAAVGSKYYNRAFFVEPSGDVTLYDKHHLFSLGGEARVYTPGEAESPIVRYRGCNIKMMVCYDLRFPVWSRNVECGYDLLLYPANWPDSREQAWKCLLQARAIENASYVVGANRTGADDFGIYSDGRSYIFNNWGDRVDHPGANGILYAELDLAQLDVDRRRFPAWRDADTFTIL